MTDYVVPNPPHWTISAEPPGFSLEASIAAFDRQIDMPFGIKHRADMARYEKIIAETKPDLLIECGTWMGGSARWFAERVPHVVTIDINNQDSVSDDGRIVFVRGDSARWETMPLTYTRPMEERVMVSLDSDHTPAHVAKELELWAPLVTPGCYLVVEDTLLHYRPSTNPDFLSMDPLVAVWDFLQTSEGSRFELDTELEAMFPVSQHPGGWLKAAR